MTLSALFDLMDVPPINPRSMHLMLRTLEKRGVIVRMRLSGGARAPIWRINPAGETL